MTDTPDVVPEMFDSNPRTRRDSKGAHRTSKDLKQLIAAAESGDAPAQHRLAEAYRKDTTLPKHLETAFRWYRAAAEQGYAKAQNDLGSMYLNGTGTPTDFDEAVRWYTAAADQGEPNAMFNLATRYRTGTGVPQDYEEAANWCQMAAIGGLVEAMSAVGTNFRFGHGETQDFEQAASWHVDAAELGDVVAMGNLSDYREDLERLALEGSRASAYFLAKMYEGGYGVDPDGASFYAWVRWGALEATDTKGNSPHSNFGGWLEQLEDELPAAVQSHGLQTIDQLKVAREALRRDWGKGVDVPAIP